MNKLTEMQYLFIHHYVNNGFNATKAALSAGYSTDFSTHQSHKLTNHPMVKQRISEILDRNIKVTLDEKIDYLLQIVNDIIPKDGSEPKRNMYMIAIKAISELNRMMGDYAPEKRLSVTVDATQKRLDDARKQYEEY